MHSRLIHCPMLSQLTEKLTLEAAYTSLSPCLYPPQQSQTCSCQLPSKDPCLGMGFPAPLCHKEGEKCPKNKDIKPLRIARRSIISRRYDTCLSHDIKLLIVGKQSHSASHEKLILRENILADCLNFPVGFCWVLKVTHSSC